MQPVINKPAPVAGFSLLEKQKYPFSKIKNSYALESRIAAYYPDGMPIGKGWRPALGEAERHRLVEAAKCPTQKKGAESDLEKAAKAAKQRQREARQRRAESSRWLEDLVNEKFKDQPERKAAELENLRVMSEREHEAGRAKRTIRPENDRKPAGDVACWTVITKRDWSGEYRIRTAVDMPAQLPPEQAGNRITKSLSEAGARKIADSCQFMHLKNGGYRTFLTLTFDEESRSKVEIREAAGPFVELDANLKAKGIEKNDAGRLSALWVGGVEVRPQSPVKYLDETADGAFCPVLTVGNGALAWATGQEGDDVTYSTIQKEVGRFFDGINKMRQRGWKAEKAYPWGKVACYEKEGKAVGEKPSKVIGIKGFLADKKIKLQRLPVRYCWVVENPLNERGQRNPHVHVLMDWRVKYSAFASWADRLESIWGQGFANLEKIKDSSVAGGYMAKAAGYLSKANGESDQGPVRGNRYGISQLSRAPDWACIGRYPLHIMGHLIKDVHDYFTACYGQQFAKRKQLNEKSTALRSELKAATDENQKKQIKGVRQRIGKALAGVRAQINELPAVASKYQLLIKSERAFFDFIMWATDKYHRPETNWLPEKGFNEAWDVKGENTKGLWATEFKFRLHARKAARRFRGLAVELYEKWVEPEKSISEIWADWSEFEKLNWGEV